jgi:DNA-binding CsgD family transcriptional regulator
VTESLHSELQALLLAEPGSGARDRLIASCRQRAVAGVCCFEFSLCDNKPSDMRPLWVEDISGELAGIDLNDLAARCINESPAWLKRWVLRRRVPFHLWRFTRFVPFSAEIILSSTAPPGRRRLGDMIVVPYRQGSRGFGATIGLFEPASRTVADELVTLATACLARQPWRDHVEQPRTLLNDRQLECLQWIVAGKSVSETARITGLSYANVRYHLDRAKEQTGFASLPQLVAHAAVAYGLSPLGPARNSGRA